MYACMHACMHVCMYVCIYIDCANFEYVAADIQRVVLWINFLLLHCHIFICICICI